MELQIVLKSYRIDTLILTVVPLPFCLMTVVVLGYFIRMRYKLYQEIRKVSVEALFKQSYKNHLKNLKIRSMIANAIIGVLILEFLQNIFYVIYLLPDWTLIFGENIRTKFANLFHIRSYVEIIVSPIRLSLVPILSMMMDLLWLVYRKYGYNYTTARWMVYILARALFMFFCHFPLSSCDRSDIPLDYCLPINLVYSLLVGSFYIFDFIQFVYFSRRFYLHLKSREKEIRLFYFDRKAYLDSKFIRIHFQVATTMVVISLFFFTFGYSLWEFLEPNYFIIKVLQPDFAYSIRMVTKSLVSYVFFPSIIIYKIMINMNYLYIFIIIVYQSFKKRQNLANINSSIRPIVEDYHNTLYKNGYTHV